MTAFLLGVAAGAIMAEPLARIRIKSLVRQHRAFVDKMKVTIDGLIERQAEINRLDAYHHRDRDLDPGSETELGEALAQSLQRSQPSSVQPWFDNIGPLDGAWK